MIADTARALAARYTPDHTRPTIGREDPRGG